MPETILNQEIHEQPEVIRQLLTQEQESINRIAESIRGRFQYIVIAARGTSDNAARYAQYLFGAYNQLSVALATPSLYTLYGRPPHLEGALVVGISQSGLSPDILAVIRTARQQGCPTIAISNDPGSPLAELSEHRIDLHAGRELAVAATKTYTSSLASLALLSTSLAGDAGRLAQLLEAPGMMAQMLSDTAPLLKRVERYRYMSHCAVVGRGFNYSTAFEIALKTKELTRVVAEPWSSADFRHGPIAMVTNGFPVFVIAPSGQVSTDIEDLIDELGKRDSELLLISDNPSLLGRARLGFPLPAGLPEWLTPLVAVLPGQLFAMSLALAKGFDPDRPHGLTKVTETL